MAHKPVRPTGPLSPVMGTYHNVLFIVSTEELATLLALAPFCISGSSRVPENEWPDGCRDYVSRYATYTAEMNRTEPLLDPMSWAFRLILRLARSSGIYAPVPKEPGRLWLDQFEPDVQIEVGGAIVNARGKLQVNIVSNDGGGVGLRLKYQKQVSYDSEGHTVQHATEAFPNFTLYRTLEAWIRGHTKPCRFASASGGTMGTQLRASPQGRETLADHAWLRSQSIRLL